MAQKSRGRRGLEWGIGVAVVLLLLGVGGPFVYVNFIADDADPRLELSGSDSSTTRPGDTRSAPSTTVAVDPADALSGTWSVTEGSEAQYRVEEILLGQNNTATGDTSEVDGTMTIDGSTVTAAEFTVDMASFESDEARRDNQFRGRIMNVAEFPTSRFELTAPIELGRVPGNREKITVTARGDLTLHGTTRAVEIELDAQRVGDVIEVLGTLPIEFSDYEIPNPSFAGITTEDNGEMEILLKLARTD
jgi:polyisoprenoid-binding protein YceI